MMKWFALVAVLAGAWVCRPASLAAQDRWSAADSATVRLAPTRFQRLPPEIVEYLVSRRCTIPQSFATTEPHNVVTGAFRRRGQRDWAVLCSVEFTSRILVFFEGSTSDVTELAEALDRNYLQGIGADQIGYSRYLGVATPEYIARQHQRYAADTPLPAIDHDGLNDSFVEKGSVVHFYLDGKWVRLVGAD